MNAEVEDWSDGQFGLRLALGPNEIDQLTENLAGLRKDADQHFHITAGGPQEPRVGDIEVSGLLPGQVHNMRLMSLALAPGTEVRDAGSMLRVTVAPGRVLGIWLLWLGAAYAGCDATISASATFATNDHGAILMHGVWMTGVALILLHGATALSKTWKGRLPGIIGALVVLSVLNVLLSRLSLHR